MAKNKKDRKNKKYRPTNCRVPVALLHRLTVPESQILKLKARHDAALLRMYMGTDNWQDRCELYSVLRFGESLCKHVKNGETIAARLRDAMHLLAKEPELTENGQRNLDLVREALDLVEGIWRVVSVEEFVSAAQALKVEEVEQWKKVRLTEHGVGPINSEEKPSD
jgi:hypothetical protein